MENLDCYICQTRGCGRNEEGTATSSCTSGGCNKLNTYNWLENTPSPNEQNEFVEVRFKNTRKVFYRNVNNLSLAIGDFVAVEASPGHDIGIVSLIGDLVSIQMKKCGINNQTFEFKKLYRKAKQADIDKWRESISQETETMLRSRKIAQRLNLNMKIGDVEYQGDKTKAIFYYIADERVDFRELIKLLADEFKVRIEMKQIGARQEAGRIGGIGPCGRELCCTTFVTNFVSVSTSAARYQELSLNPQKLAGQCSKLKCCINYEIDTYLDAIKDFPDTAIALEIMDGTAYHQKTDVFKRTMWYSYDRENTMNMTPVPVNRVKEIIAMNKNGKKPDNLVIAEQKEKKVEFENVVGQESINRFDEQKKSRNKKRRR